MSNKLSAIECNIMATTVTITPSVSDPSDAPADPFDGLVWIPELEGVKPTWAYDPQLSAIEKEIRRFGPLARPEIKYLTEGAFNKIYKVQFLGYTFILRVSLPTAPGLKTRSEVATLDWVSRRTDLPLPHVFAYDPTRNNDIGFEWMLMTELPGHSLNKLWTKLSMTHKTALVKRLVDFQASMWKNQLSGIGNLYHPFIVTGFMPLMKTERTENSLRDVFTQPRMGQIVSLDFLWGNRARQNVNRGPFSCSLDWINARLSIARAEHEEALAKYHAMADPGKEEKYAKEDAEEILPILSKLEILASRLFPCESDIEEPTVITHGDLNFHNILVNEAGDLTGVLDWECVSALPLWKACYYPQFLQGFERLEKPDPGLYLDPDPEWYEADLREWEVTILREVFIDEMRKVEPAWVQVFDSSYLLREFDTALEYVNSEISRKDVNKWVDAVLGGDEKPTSLRETIGI